MRKIFIPLIAITASAAVNLYADKNSEYTLADAAFAAGDYVNAISGYRNAMQLADGENDSEMWARNALQLADAYLRYGDLNGARAVYAEFRRRNPLRSAGILPGELLAADGKYAEAEKFFTSVIAGNPELAAPAAFSLGMLKLRTGDLNGAYKIFSELAKGDSVWAEQGKYETVYTLIRMGKNGEALAGLGAVAKEKRNANWELLFFLADTSAGKIENFKKAFAGFIEKQPHKPHIRLIELLSTAASAAVKVKDHAFAMECLQSALDLSSEETVKREIFRRMINVAFMFTPETAAEKAMLYAATFPGAADRGDILNTTGRMLVEKRDFVRAVKIFSAVSDDPSMSLNDRLDAATEIIALNEKKSVDIDPSKYYKLLGDNSITASKRSLWQSRFAAFLEKSGDISGALREFERALNSAPAMEKEKKHFDLMNFFVRSGNNSGIKREADFLSSARDVRYRAAAKFELGKLAESTGNFVDAKKFYREAANSGKSGIEAEAVFQSALMSLRVNDFAVAGKEFSDFAAKYTESSAVPHALYHAAEAFKESGNTAAEKQALQMLKEKFSGSEVWAYAVINSANERSEAGDISGAIAELETLEENFSVSAAGNEAVMLKAVLLDKKGSSDEALKEFQEIIANNISPEISAESCMYAGEIFARRRQFKAAKDMFLKAASLYKSGLLHDIATGRAIDCDLEQNILPDPSRSNEIIARCERLAATTEFPQIRIQILYKLGLCRENAGDHSGAVSAYEKLIYAATELVSQGINPEKEWCIRSVESALDILCRYRLPGALQRGLRIINKFDALKIGDISGAELRKNFRDQLKNTRRK